MLDICNLSLDSGYDIYSAVNTPLYVYVSFILCFVYAEEML